MKLVENITQKEIGNVFKKVGDKGSDEFVVSKEYEVYKKLTTEDQIKDWQKEIAEYEKETEPTEKELIEIGKNYHPYYDHQLRLAELQERIKNYQNIKGDANKL